MSPFVGERSVDLRQAIPSRSQQQNSLFPVVGLEDQGNASRLVRDLEARKRQ